MTKKELALPVLSLVLMLAYFYSYFSQKHTPRLLGMSLFRLDIRPTLPIQPISDLPGMSSQNYILIDRDTNQILISKNEHQSIYPASTTKLATALTALNVYELAKPIPITTRYSEGKTIGLVIGASYTVQSLLKAILIYSANDAAVALSNAYPEGSAQFISSMNSLVKQYGLKNTNFTNVDGTDNPNHFSTAYDLSQLGRVASNLKQVVEIVGLQKDTITSIDAKFSHEITTTNELLGKESEIVGLKTGWTPTAGEAFVGLIKYKNHTFISVVADSRDRFGDTQKMLNWLRQQNFNSN